MTNLTKPVKRVSSAQIREVGKLRDIVVILYPNRTIGFRAKGCKREYHLPIETGYMLAVRAYVVDEKKRKKKERDHKHKVKK